MPKVDGGCGLSTILRGAGFSDYWVYSYTAREVREYLKRNEIPHTAANWSDVARGNGFIYKGRKWEKWPA
ncbi:hypothetical protein D3C85_1599110 [compost metagenome]